MQKLKYVSIHLCILIYFASCKIGHRKINIDNNNRNNIEERVLLRSDFWGVWFIDSISINGIDKIIPKNKMTLEFSDSLLHLVFSLTDTCGYNAVYSIKNDSEFNFIYCPVTINTQMYKHSQQFKDKYFFLNLQNIGNGLNCLERKQDIGLMLNRIKNYTMSNNKLVLSNNFRRDFIILNKISTR